MGISRHYRPGISVKLILVNLLLLAVFAASSMLTFHSFGTVEQLMTRTVTTDIELNLANASVLRELTGIFSQASQLLGNFIKNEKELETHGVTLVADMERLTATSSDRRISAPLQEYSRRLRTVFETCTAINVVIRKIEQQEQSLHKNIEALDRTISDRKIKLILKGHDPAIMEQLAVLVSGFHDTLQEINLFFFRTISDKSSLADNSRNRQLLAMIDDLSLRLQTLSASEQQIGDYAPRLIASVKAYRAMIEGYYQARETLERQKNQLEESRGKVLGVMQRIDDEIAASTRGISSQVHTIMIESRRKILLIAAGLALISGVVIVFFIITTIRRPMTLINTGIEAIAAGNLDTRISLNRRDEWDHIEKALNRMSGELKQSYSELEQQHGQLEVMVRDRTHELEQAQAELVKREKLAVLGQLTATVSHELRNPLGVIRSSAFYLQNRLGDGDEKVAKHLARIEQHVGLCDGIVADLLEFTRGRLSEKAPGEINSWLEPVLNTVALPAGIELVCLLAPQMPHVRFDPDKLRRVVQNLVENAVHAVCALQERMVDGGEYLPRIVIRTCFRDGAVVLEVEDNGSGMAKNTVERAFEPLFTTRAQGTGLGLAIVQKIVEEHGGAVSISSVPGRGTRVTVELPPEA